MKTDGPGLVNRLSAETSPYLLQHAGNPVHWQPWDGEAFEAARDLDRPVFLSIGYSTCHWCHVMAEESFEDDAVASLLNGSFVCIKVDREERPDIDNVYMRFAMAMNGSGGWPLNVVMTPDGRPFFAATYIPGRSSFGRRGMLELIPLIDDAWRNRREEVVSAASSLTGSLFGMTAAPPREKTSADPAGTVFRQLRASYDARWGGFGSAPRFPAAHNLLFLLRYHWYRGEPQALDMACRILAAIRHGGIWDQLGGGIHRYSTDREWRVPHFEKMLYDQSMTALAALEAFQATGHDLFAEMAAGLLDFVVGGMASPDGGFFSALDADSPEGEGAFYMWRGGEMASVLDPDTASGLERMWCMEAEGGGQVPRLRFPPPGSEPSGPPPVPDPGVRRLLLEYRDGRPSPMLDRKILADWNGMTVAALARGSLVLSRPDYLRAARKAMEFIGRCMILADGRLAHSHVSGSPGRWGFLDDYAFVVWACIEMHNASPDGGFLDMALSLQALQDSLFREPAEGCYRFAASDGEGISLPDNVMTHDGAVPSGNSVTLLNLYRLWSVTGGEDLRRSADTLAASLSGVLNSSPVGHTMLAAAMLSGPGHPHITLLGDPSDPVARAMLENAASVYLPDLTLSVRRTEGPAAASVCAGGACMPDTDSSEILRSMLEGLRCNGAPQLPRRD